MSVIVGYVPNRFGRVALRYAVEEAKRRGCPMVVINSHRGGPETAGHHVDENLAAATASLTEAGVPFEIRGLVRGNDPAEDLVDVADELNADCIVIGLRRRSPVGKLLLGSNAQQILLDAHCPVIAVKAGHDD